MAFDIMFDGKRSAYYSYKEGIYEKEPLPGNTLVAFAALDFNDINNYINRLFQNVSINLTELEKKCLDITNFLVILHVYFSVFNEKISWELNDSKERIENCDITLEAAEKDLKNVINDCLEIALAAQKMLDNLLSLFEDDISGEVSFQANYLFFINGPAWPKLSAIVMHPQLIFKELNGVLFEVIRFSTNGNDLSQIINICEFEFMRLVTANLSGSIDLRLKECSNCHRLFIKRGNYKTEYCDRLVPGTKRTCKQVGAQKAYRYDHKDDEIRKTYEKEYNTRYRRVHDYGIMDDNQFTKWKKSAKHLKNQALRENWSKEKFLKEINGIDANSKESE